MSSLHLLPEAVMSRAILFYSTDTLWDLAAEKVRAKERRTGPDRDAEDDDDHDDDKEDSHAPYERTVFFIGSKAGVKKTSTIISTVLSIFTHVINLSGQL